MAGEGGGISLGSIAAGVGAVARTFVKHREGGTYSIPPPRPTALSYAAFEAARRPAPRRGGWPLVARALPGTPGSPVPAPSPPPPVPGDPVGRLLYLAELVRWLVETFRKPKLPGVAGLEVVEVPYLLSNAFSMPGGGGSFGGESLGVGLAGLGAGIGSIISAIRGPSAMPGGASFLPTIARGAGAIATGVGLAQLFGGGGACPTDPFASGGSSVRAQTFVAAHPETGRAVWFKPAGRPILWSGDLSACRRVRKVAGRARRRVGGR